MSALKIILYAQATSCLEKQHKKSRGTLFQAWKNFLCLLFTIKLLGKAVRGGKRDKDSPEYLPKLYANNQHKFKTNKKQYSTHSILSLRTVLYDEGEKQKKGESKHRQCS